MRITLLLLAVGLACSNANGAPRTKDQEWADAWMAKNCKPTLIEPGKRCSFCQGELPPFPKARAAGAADLAIYDDMTKWSDGGWMVVTLRLGGARAVERGVTYCENK
jgi:hypothetical protein